MNIKNIAIVGGGTSGLVCALILRKTYPNLPIDIIESDSVGIVGVGEGTTEHWSKFMFHCDIDLIQLLRETDATFKYGIKFSNWNGDGKDFMHAIESTFAVQNETNLQYVLAYLISNSNYHEDTLVHPHIKQSLHTKPFDIINQFHFDTFKLNSFLHRLCQERNINIIKCKIDDVILDNLGHIDYVISDNKQILQYDFYVDASGFHRMLLKKKLGANWIGYGKFLPANSAVAFRTERKNTLPSYTLSRSMKSGWLWRIPTQNSYGNGYVFNKDFLSVDNAKKEIEQLYGHEIEIGKQIDFEAGHLDKSFIKNCAAIGLSSSFVEPLEASAIGFSIQQSFLLSEMIWAYSKYNDYAEKVYNQISSEMATNILDFISLHYCVKRTDTDFWKYVQTLPKTEGLKEKLDLFKHSFPASSHFKNRDLLFKESNWIYVMSGLGILPRNTAKKVLETQPNYIKQSLGLGINSMFDTKTKEKKVSQNEAIDYLLKSNI